MRIFLKVLAGIAVAMLMAVIGLRLWLQLPAAPPPVAAQPLPADFIWGVSTSGFQGEGGDVDSAVLRGNKKAVGAAKDPQDPYGKAVDFRHRYRDDIALAHELGVNTFRIGISWARIEPKKGQIDQAELAYYDDLLRALKEAGIRPLVTLEHFDQPGWVADQGGWTNAQTVDDFLAYVGLVVGRYRGDVQWWLTFNETALYMAAHTVKEGRSAGGAIRRNMISAHRRGYELIHQLEPQAMVSSNLAWAGDTTFSRIVENGMEWAFLDQVADRMDYIGVDYYTSSILEIGKGDWNWYQDPPGLYRSLRFLAGRFPHLPLLITENGMATQDGKPRADGVRREDALRDSVYWVQRARADGINVIGYMVWSITDNFEWGSYSPRFGLYTINALTDPTLVRIPTAAVPAYQAIIAGHGVPLEYRPVVR